LILINGNTFLVIQGACEGLASKATANEPDLRSLETKYEPSASCLSEEGKKR